MKLLIRNIYLNLIKRDWFPLKCVSLMGMFSDGPQKLHPVQFDVTILFKKIKLLETTFAIR